MKIDHNGKQYARFGDMIAVRAAPQPGQPVEDWVNYAIDDLTIEERVAIQTAENGREYRATRPRRQPAVITRSAENIRRAEELGFTGSEADVGVGSRSDTPSAADTLAQRLTDRGSLGTTNRVSEERFDEIAQELGLDPEEMRARFRGEFPE